MIPPSFIQDLLNRIDIVDVVGRYVQLKKRGANYMGLCPFHNEKTPSFTVSPTKQFYHCFGCGAHGTTIGFVMEYAGLGFVEAVKDLAQGVGMVVPEDDDVRLPAQRAEQKAKSLALSEVMSLAADYYCRQLRETERARNYLIGRGLSGQIAKRYALGYAPDAWDDLRSVFPDYESDALVECGLVIDRSEEKNAHHKRYDRFRDRIMFPIRNTKGQVIAFGARIIDKGKPKYLNSPETPLFQKGNELYGLFEARQAISKAGYVLVTEGYMDVVALAQLGFAQAVATLGTACTSVHVQKLLRQTDLIIFAFDGDAAGQRAARRALEASLPYANEKKTIKFLFLPGEHDPDSFVREYGAEAFEKEIRNATFLSHFLLKEAAGDKDLTIPEGRAKTQQEAQTMLQMMPDSNLRAQIVAMLAERTGSTAEKIASQIPSPQRTASQSRRKTPPPAPRPPPQGLILKIMQILIAHPVLVSDVDEQAQAAIWHQATEDEQGMLNQLMDICREMGLNANFAALAETLKERGNASEFNPLIEHYSAGRETDQDEEQNALHETINKLKLQWARHPIDVELAHLSGLIDNKQGDENTLKRMRELNNQLQAWIKKFS